MGKFIIDLKKGSVRFKNPHVFNNALTRQAKQLAARRVNRIKTTIIEKVRRLIYQSISESDVIKALLGANYGEEDGSDLPAEFGLTTQDAQEGVNAILSYLIDPSNIRMRDLSDRVSTSFISGTGKTTTIPINIQYLPGNYKQALSDLPEGSHPSRVDGSGYSIEWIAWMLNNPKMIAVPARIIYLADGSKLRDVSRSTRAIMITKNLQPGPMNEDTASPEGYMASWMMPSLVLPVKKSNWIADILLDERFKAMVAKTVAKTAADVIGRFRK
jgi:hypothetical protein